MEENEHSTYPEWITNTKVGKYVYYAVAFYAIGKGALKGLGYAIRETIK